MKPRLGLVTLGVADVAASTAFYERLGLERGAASNAAVTYFDMNGIVPALYGRSAPAEDGRVSPVGAGFSGVTLAWNLASEGEVDAARSAAIAAGGRPVKAAEKVFRGGYSGYFADPDGRLGEVAHNPFFPLDGVGAVHLPEGDHGGA